MRAIRSKLEVAINKFQKAFSVYSKILSTSRVEHKTIGLSNHLLETNPCYKSSTRSVKDGD